MRTVLHGVSGLAYVFLFLPIVSLIIVSFNSASLTSLPIDGWSLRWYEAFFDNRAAWAALGTSLGVALACAVVTTILGLMAAYGLVRIRFPGKRLLQALIVLPIIVPHLVFGIDLLLFFKAIGISPNAFTVCIAHIVLAFPFAVLLISTSLSGFDPTLEDAAQDLGANEHRTFFRVTLPLIAPGVVSAILVSFTVSFDEFVVSFFVSGKGVVTLPLFLYSELRFSVTPEINAISTFVLAISVLVIGLMQWLQGRMGRRR